MLIIFTACTLMAADCHEIVVPLTEEAATPYACAFQGQIVVSEWLREHEHSHKLNGGYTCTTPERRKQAV